MKRADRMIRINCFRHLSAFKLEAKITLDFCFKLFLALFRKETRLFFYKKRVYLIEKRMQRNRKKALDRFV
ncbi:hypothetical protein BWO99_01130 [Enterococcus faecalis ATCC 29212]|nr:hypothetical protein [Enterococcus faecalis]OOC97692.1 hypothetical protein BWO99_01130 [Enterococcus faecalis ATCC 29212]OSM19451.1 hypothetical protein B6S42_05400 [Enterococcus faecalis]TXW51386.1 hypothetical protein D4M44_05860 [Enterococcus faecalis]CBL32049.1 hypothetical protein ENT_15540 [Enterococcus faecalis]